MKKDQGAEAPPKPMAVDAGPAPAVAVAPPEPKPSKPAAPAIRTVQVKAKTRIDYDGKTHPPGAKFAMEPEVAELAAQRGAVEFT